MHNLPEDGRLVRGSSISHVIGYFSPWIRRTVKPVHPQRAALPAESGARLVVINSPRIAPAEVRSGSSQAVLSSFLNSSSNPNSTVCLLGHVLGLPLYFAAYCNASGLQKPRSPSLYYSLGSLHLSCLNEMYLHYNLVI